MSLDLQAFIFLVYTAPAGQTSEPARLRAPPSSQKSIQCRDCCGTRELTWPQNSSRRPQKQPKQPKMPNPTLICKGQETDGQMVRDACLHLSGHRVSGLPVPHPSPPRAEDPPDKPVQNSLNGFYTAVADKLKLQSSFLIAFSLIMALVTCV